MVHLYTILPRQMKVLCVVLVMMMWIHQGNPASSIGSTYGSTSSSLLPFTATTTGTLNDIGAASNTSTNATNRLECYSCQGTIQRCGERLSSDEAALCPGPQFDCATQVIDDIYTRGCAYRVECLNEGDEYFCSPNGCSKCCSTPRCNNDILTAGTSRTRFSQLIFMTEILCVAFYNTCIQYRT